MNTLRTALKARWKSLAAVGMAVSLLGAGSGFALNRYLSTSSGEDCCAPGATCCHPGSPCCARHHRTAQR